MILTKKKFLVKKVCDNITPKWLETMFFSILLCEKHFTSKQKSLELIIQIQKPFPLIMIICKHRSTPGFLGSCLVQNKDMISCHTYIILWLSSQSKYLFDIVSEMYCMVENYPVYENSRNCNSSWSKSDWIYNINNNCVLMATKKHYFPKNDSKSSNFLNRFIAFSFTKILSSAYLPQSGSAMATRRSSRSSSTNSSKPTVSKELFHMWRNTHSANQKVHSG